MDQITAPPPLSEEKPPRAEGSPFLPERLMSLFVRPTEFFKDTHVLMRTANIVVVTMALGMTNAADRIDRELLKADIKGTPITGSGPFANFEWPVYWGILVFGGIVGALGAWYLAGWWYHRRLQMCGATNADAKLARTVYVYASFVYAAPVVLIAVYETFRYENYAAAYASEDPTSFLVLVMLFWSVVVSYKGVRALFEVDAAKARTWFLVLPIVVYAVVLGGLAAVIGLLAPGS